MKRLVRVYSIHNLEYLFWSLSTNLDTYKHTHTHTSLNSEFRQKVIQDFEELVWLHACRILAKESSKPRVAMLHTFVTRYTFVTKTGSKLHECLIERERERLRSE